MTEYLTRDPATPDVAQWSTAPPVTEPYDDSALRAAVAKVQADLASEIQQDADEDAKFMARLAALEAQPDDDIDDEARAEIEVLKARPTGTGATAGTSAKTPFNSLGADDTARFKELVRRAQTGWRGEVEFEVRNHNCPIQIPTLAGIRCYGTATPAREFGTGTLITYTGPAGTSLFQLTKNTGYSYPGSGASRDVHWTGFQFNAGSDKDFLPAKLDGVFDTNYVQWYWTFKDCSWVGWRYIARGWGTGLDNIGTVHFQGMKNVTPWDVGGSEMRLFGDGSLVDSNDATWKAAGLPFIRYASSKSVIGPCMISARGQAYQLQVVYGHNSQCIQTRFDAPDDMPTLGYQVRFMAAGAGATNFGFIGCSFKGGGGIWAKDGATEISVDSSSFHLNRGLARLEAAFTGVLKWGVTNTYGNCPRVIYAARKEQVICLDPTVEIRSLDGATVLQGKTR